MFSVVLQDQIRHFSLSNDSDLTVIGALKMTLRANNYYDHKQGKVKLRLYIYMKKKTITNLNLH